MKSMDHEIPNDSETPSEAPEAAATGGHWVFHCDFRFGYDRSELDVLDRNKARAIARYLLRNPGLRAGVDGFTGSRSASPRNLQLAAHRATAVQKALIEAGLPEDRVEIGAFGDKQLARDSRVAVLVGEGG
jgi:outer membrane protein OmpA-like peptidoglycan-associated protein